MQAKQTGMLLILLTQVSINMKTIDALDKERAVAERQQVVGMQ